MSNGIESSRRFYDKKVAPMIHEKYKDYESRIAVGLVGEGSDCFGYDDFISRDHDFGTGVCLWLTDRDMLEIGDRLSSDYENLVDSVKDSNLTERLRQRRGVMTIHGFYSNVLGIDCDTDNGVLTERDWRMLDHNCLATAVNGEVFRDDSGRFTAFRNLLLAYYPDKVWKTHIVNELHKFSAALQVNYARCMSRGDVVAARLCHMQGLEAAMELYFLMKRIYAPYYKWTYRRLSEIEESNEFNESDKTNGTNGIKTGLGKSFSELVKQLAAANPDLGAWEGLEYKADSLNLNDTIVFTTERIAARIASMLRGHSLTEGTDTYLERYVNEIIKKMR